MSPATVGFCIYLTAKHLTPVSHAVKCAIVLVFVRAASNCSHTHDWWWAAPFFLTVPRLKLIFTCSFYG